MSYADRYLIIAILGEQALGLYTVGYTIAMYIGDMIMFSLSSAMVPIYVKIYGEEGREKTEAFLRKCLRYLLIAIIPMWFGYMAISKELFIILASEKYAAAARFSPLILLAHFFMAMVAVFNAGFYLKKKTMLTFLIIFSAIILNIGLNFILLKRLELMGASISILVSCIFMAILTLIISNRYITVRVEMGTILYNIGVSFIMFLVLTQINTGVLWMNLILKIATGVVLVGLGILFKENEIRENVKKIYPWRIR
jgi:O-antigen/teichoic acid export membrane protein